MTDRLRIYNSALTNLGERSIISLEDNEPSQRILDSVWDDAIDHCLEQGLWSFATRTVELFFTPSVEPPFGFKFAFVMPDDFITFVAVCTDERFYNPANYHTEGNYIYSDSTTLFIRYVSNHVEFGGNVGKWSSTYAEFVAAYLAKKVSRRIKSGTDVQYLDEVYKETLKNTRNKDAIRKAERRPPLGRFSRARLRGW